MSFFVELELMVPSVNSLNLSFISAETEQEKIKDMFNTLVQERYVVKVPFECQSPASTAVANGTSVVSGISGIHPNLPTVRYSTATNALSSMFEGLEIDMIPSMSKVGLKR